MLVIRSAHLFDGERFASGPATVIVHGATITGGGMNTLGRDVLRTQFTAEEMAFLVREVCATTAVIQRPDG